MRSIAGLAAIALTANIGWHGGGTEARPVRELAPQQFNARAAESCGAGKDLVVRALEILEPRSSLDQLQDADQLLKRALDLCSESGDAWYYRSLVEAKLNRAALATYALSQARRYPSDALDEGLSPFQLATPATRGVMREAGSSGSSARAPAAKPGPIQHRWALVIGLNHFSAPDIGSLKYATQDADAFAAELKDPQVGGFAKENVFELTDAEATVKNIRTQLYRIGQHAEANDLVVIYVATHGSPRDMDPLNGVNYLLTYDTQLSSGSGFDASMMYGTALPMVTLTEAVASLIKSFRTLVILDTCYSGGSVAGSPPPPHAGPRNSAPSPQMLKAMTEGTGRIVLAASQSDEPSLESATLGHGLFTYSLLTALRAGKSNEPISQVFAEAAQDVARLAAKAGGSQHPVMYRSSEDADFSLGVGRDVALLAR